MEKLSEDVLNNIFIRLPAKQLVQMRRVCKPWNAFLSESYFIKSHLNHSIRNKHNNEIVLAFNAAIRYRKHALPCTVYDLSQSPDIKLNDLVKLPHNFPQSALHEYGGHVIGSVNGLICFYIGRYYDVKGIYIWNPSLSAVKLLPPISEPLIQYDYKNNGLRSRYIFSFGFGFDPMTDDYKVLKITHDRDKSVWLQVEVYSIKKDSWEFIIVDDSFPEDVVGIFVDDHDGHLYALSYFKKNHIQKIVVFDLGVESFRQMSLPDSVVANCNILGMLDGKLCLVSYTQHDGKLEVWVIMNEYGVARDSWVKSHVLSNSISKACGDIIPFGFTSNNKFFFYAYSRGLLGVYDQETYKVTYFGSFTSGLDEVVQYVDSLVWYS
uniref:F-box/kelch-repeat protein At3g06240-like n=1 Tax=Erigeron canadensis TaxID=72917 RepID=UPI001CB9D396|nr:F-box/kelch-repeat protein At3g06240-like [Erigeron canadensis]